MRIAILACLLMLPAARGESFLAHVSDSKCGKGHADGTPASVKCAAGCLRAGRVPVLVTGTTVIQVTPASYGKLEPFAGKRVRVEGDFAGREFAVSSAAAATGSDAEAR